MVANITLVQLRALTIVVAENGFSAAAQRLGLTQSAVSQSIAGLEAMLGIALLVRGREGIRVTAAGEEILADARRALDAVERISQKAAAMAGLEVGTLRVASVRSAAARLLPSVLREFRMRYPRIELVLFEGSDTEISDWIETRVAEVGLSADRRQGVLSDEVIHEDLFLLVTRRGHRLAGRRSVSIDDIGAEPFILSTDGCEPLIRKLFDQHGNSAREPNVQFRVQDMTALLAMVREGLGVTIVPEMSLPAGDLIDLRNAVLDPAIRRSLFLISPLESPRSPAATAFMELLREFARSPAVLRGIHQPNLSLAG